MSDALPSAANLNSHSNELWRVTPSDAVRLESRIHRGTSYPSSDKQEMELSCQASDTPVVRPHRHPIVVGVNEGSLAETGKCPPPCRDPNHRGLKTSLAAGDQSCGCDPWQGIGQHRNSERLIKRHNGPIAASPDAFCEHMGKAVPVSRAARVSPPCRIHTPRGHHRPTGPAPEGPQPINTQACEAPFWTSSARLIRQGTVSIGTKPRRIQHEGGLPTNSTKPSRSGKSRSDASELGLGRCSAFPAKQLLCRKRSRSITAHGRATFRLTGLRAVHGKHRLPMESAIPTKICAALWLTM